MQTVKFSNDAIVPALGQGTWHMGRSADSRAAEADALRLGMDLGMTLIDTAEMYHDAESVVGEALKGRRDEAFIVSKVLPSNASYSGTLRACEKSLGKLRTDHIDLYLLHWPGSHPLEETVRAFEELVARGSIGAWGVSNFDTAEMEALSSLPGGDLVMTNQVLYNLEVRNIEWSLLPWCRQREVTVMAYSPLNQGNIDLDKLESMAHRYSVNPAQVALAWLLHQDQVMVIPKSADPVHVTQNASARDIRLDREDLVLLDEMFPPPAGDSYLPML